MGRLARLELCAKKINTQFSDYSLIDVGCRTKALLPLLNGCTEYYGTDLIAGEGVIECDLERGLPFADSSFDIATVLDVLEHLNHPHEALKEIVRVARKAVYVSLPNMYYISFRLNFLRGRLSGKYAFHPTPVLDRHRWVMSYDEAVRFVYANAGGHKVSHQMLLPIRGRTKWLSGPIEKWLGKTFPNLFGYGVLVEIRVDG